MLIHILENIQAILEDIRDFEHPDECSCICHGNRRTTEDMAIEALKELELLENE